VIREERLEKSQWRVVSLHYHKGVCPACNDAVDADAEKYQRCHEGVSFEQLRAIGETGAENLREKGIATRQDVKDASDEEILETPWVGEKGLRSIRQAVQ